MNMKKHVAKTNTDQRCVVLFMQIPGREDHALICATDALPDRMEQAVMEVVESPEGQNDTVLANVLSRRLLPDTGENLMKALHDRGYLRPIHVDNLFMLPMPNTPFPLRDIIENMGGTVPNTRQSQVRPDSAYEKFNPHAEIKQTESSEESYGTARNLIAEAEMLESEARTKRMKAYRLAPELSPNAVETLPVATKQVSESVAREAVETMADPIENDDHSDDTTATLPGGKIPIAAVAATRAKPKRATKSAKN